MRSMCFARSSLRIGHRRAQDRGDRGAAGASSPSRAAPIPGRWAGSSPGGDASFNVLIRTLEWRKGQPKARLGLGSGLVVDSVPSDEWAECLLKGDFVRRESQDFDLIETMGFDPSEGIVELDRHLDRMRNSAADLDFQFDRHAARNELQAATFGRKQRAMVRLLLSRSGAMAIQVKPYDDPEEVPVTVAVRPLPVDPTDFRLRYKTTDRRFLDLARQEEQARVKRCSSIPKAS